MLTIGQCATLACLWEATAPKPGNVYRGADFEDLTYADFVTSAAVIGPIVDNAREQGVGVTIRRAVEATRLAVDTNTNLGMLLLILPLAAVERNVPLTSGIGRELDRLNATDTREVYQAIRLARPGGLGEATEADVHDEPPEIALREAMALAAERDSIARQYVNGFQQVFEAADFVSKANRTGQPMGEAIVLAFLKLLARYPDSLIARKCGHEFAEEVSARAAKVLDSADYPRQLSDFDFWLRSDGHRRNPGTTADLIAAGLFVLLRDERLDWPVQFYSP